MRGKPKPLTFQVWNWKPKWRKPQTSHHEVKPTSRWCLGPRMMEAKYLACFLVPRALWSVKFGSEEEVGEPTSGWTSNDDRWVSPVRLDLTSSLFRDLPHVCGLRTSGFRLWPGHQVLGLGGSLGGSGGWSILMVDTSRLCSQALESPASRYRAGF